MWLHKFFGGAHLYYNKVMNPLFNVGKLGLGVCETCHANPCSCNKCPKDNCACPEPFINLDEIPNKPGVYRVNDNGKNAIWDLRKGIKGAQTDTSLVVDIIKRVLQFSAERHTDTITAQELGTILHLTDLGDVSTKGATNGAMMVYKQTDTCPAGCYGTGNVWEAWNALDQDNIVSSAAYAYGFNANGQPVTLQQPLNPNQYYNLGWNGNNQLSYAQPTEETAVIVDSQGYAYQQYLNPQTMQPYFVKVKVS